MTAADAAANDAAWEKELAPKVTLGQVLFPAGLFTLWMAFLIYIAIDRWFGSLQ
jgi:hypothetical protein